MKRFLVPFVLIAGAVRLAPQVLKRSLAPPQRAQPHSPADMGLPEQDVTLTSVNGTELRGWFIPVEGRAPGVAVLHGWGGNASLMLPLAPHLHRAGFQALFIDARNHGRSEHDDFVSLPRFAEDLEVAVRWLHHQEGVTSVGVVGHSVGAGAAILAASRTTTLDAVVSVSAFAHPGETMETGAPFRVFPRPFRGVLFRWIENTIGVTFDDIAPRSRIAKVTAPILLVHGSEDDVVSPDNMDQLLAVRPDADSLLIPGAGHADLGAFESYVHRILGFLATHLN